MLNPSLSKENGPLLTHLAGIRLELMTLTGKAQRPFQFYIVTEKCCRVLSTLKLAAIFLAQDDCLSQINRACRS